MRFILSFLVATLASFVCTANVARTPVSFDLVFDSLISIRLHMTKDTESLSYSERLFLEDVVERYVGAARSNTVSVMQMSDLLSIYLGEAPSAVLSCAVQKRGRVALAPIAAKLSGESRCLKRVKELMLGDGAAQVCVTEEEYDERLRLIRSRIISGHTCEF